jgi:hypothetical protein
MMVVRPRITRRHAPVAAVRRTLIAALLVVAAARPAHATAQVANVIVVDGVTHALWTEPLYGSGLTLVTDRMAHWGHSTACWAGFRSVWAIRDGRLWFVGTRECGGAAELAADQVLKGVDTHEVVADGYTGRLILPQGPLVRYVHAGWASLYAAERRISVVEGRVVSDEVVQLVAPGFSFLTALGMYPGLLVPDDIALSVEAFEFVEDGGDNWVVYPGASPHRALRIKTSSGRASADPAQWRGAVDDALTAQVGRSTQPRSYVDVDEGLVGWVDEQGSRDTLRRVFAWATTYGTDTFVVELPKASADEMEAFTKQLGLVPR